MSTASVPTRRRGGSARRQALLWGIVLGTIGIITGMIALTGGFASGGEPYKGVRVQPGDVIETRFWEVAVHEAQYELTGEAQEGKLIISMTVMNLQQEAQFDTTKNMFVVRVPGRGVMDGSYCTPVVGRELQPLIRREAVCDFSFEGNEFPPPAPGEPLAFQLIVLDQMMSTGYLEESRPQAGDPAAWLELTAEQLVEEEA